MVPRSVVAAAGLSPPADTVSVMMSPRRNNSAGSEMPKELIHNRGRGPELVGTRVTVYSLLPHLTQKVGRAHFLATS